MKKCLLFFAIFYTNFAFAQFQDSFNDGNFTSSPIWTGSVSAFRVNSSAQLQTAKSDSAGIKYLSTESTLSTDVSWEFYIQLNFAPSASNFACIYLISDKQDLNDELQGYYIQIGENGSKDSYDLYKADGDQSELLIDGRDGRAGGSKVMAHIRVNRTKEGKWTLLSKNAGESSYSVEGEAKDSRPIFTTKWFGVQCIYTKSRSDQFIFDDFVIGSLKDDGTPPDNPGPNNPGSGDIEPGDILVNEVLFNPRAEGVDFVEVYNNSGKVLDLANLSIATVKKDSLTSIKAVSPTAYPFSPGSYLVLTTDPDNIRKEYFTENPDAFLKMASMPAFNNDAGTVVLLADSIRIDQFDYNEKMHFPLIKNPDGVSLERVSFNRPANEAGNFRSAAGVVGYATPGYKNSQFAEAIPFEEEIFLNSKTFSPDNDGFEDALMINYKFPQAGKVANITVYNEKGVLIKRLAKNMSLATEGVISWDGLNEDSIKPPVGIYILYIELFDTNGSVKRYRRPCVLAAKL
ncbi:lamin tail domain-containing protein [Arcticibacter tournemirensis]